MRRTFCLPLREQGQVIANVERLPESGRNRLPTSSYGSAKARYTPTVKPDQDPGTPASESKKLTRGVSRTDGMKGGIDPPCTPRANTPFSSVTILSRREAALPSGSVASPEIALRRLWRPEHRDAVCVMARRNYKVYASVVPDRHRLARKLVVLDTGPDQTSSGRRSYQRRYVAM